MRSILLTSRHVQDPVDFLLTKSKLLKGHTCNSHDLSITTISEILLKEVNHLHDTFLALPWYCINIGPFLWNGSSKSNFSLISDK